MCGVRGSGRLAVSVALALSVPTILGIIADRLMGTGPWATVLGVGSGVLLASAVVTREVLRRYAQLAPVGPEEEATR